MLPVLAVTPPHLPCTHTSTHTHIHTHTHSFTQTHMHTHSHSHANRFRLTITVAPGGVSSFGRARLQRVVGDASASRDFTACTCLLVVKSIHCILMGYMPILDLFRIHNSLHIVHATMGVLLCDDDAIIRANMEKITVHDTFRCDVSPHQRTHMHDNISAAYRRPRNGEGCDHPVTRGNQR